MSIARSTRLLVGLLSAGLHGLIPVALAAPAQAGAAVTSIDATISKQKAIYNDSFSIYGSTTCNDAGADGAIELLRRKAGTDRWVSLGTDTASYFSFDLTAVQNASYALRYPGTATCGASQIGGTQKVYRRMNDRIVSSTLTLKGKVQPAWKRKPVVVQVKKGGRWVTYAKVRTNRKSQWSKRLYAVSGGRRTYFRAFVSGTTQFEKSYTGTYYTYRYGRTSPRVSAE
jgi:hypothetical protein